MPGIIGVITSPTGAVIRDILHRIADRWPCRVMVWPVVVQGEAAAGQVRAAIEGFGALTPGGAVPRPDLIIVARGGGSVEDLWPFNDEALARAAAASSIPLISAVGHETDTTLIDHVADRRAPTPTAAAELATPVLADLVAGLADSERRLTKCAAHAIDIRRTRLSAAARGLPRPPDLLAIANQSLDLAASRLAAALRANVERHRHDLTRLAAPLRPRLLSVPIEHGRQRLAEAQKRLKPCLDRSLTTLASRLTASGKLLASLEPRAPLKRGFALVWSADKRLVRSAAGAAPGAAVELEFADGRLPATLDGEAPFALKP
jgi:exodeoxyribonuclease VII large subunit